MKSCPDFAGVWRVTVSYCYKTMKNGKLALSKPDFDESVKSICTARICSVVFTQILPEKAHRMMGFFIF